MEGLKLVNLFCKQLISLSNMNTYLGHVSYNAPTLATVEHQDFAIQFRT